MKPFMKAMSYAIAATIAATQVWADTVILKPSVAATPIEIPGQGGISATPIEIPGQGGISATPIEIPGTGGVSATPIEIPRQSRTTETTEEND